MSVLETIKNDDFTKHLGLEFTELTKEKAVAKIPFSKELCNPYGSLHGGVLYSVADIVCGTLACTCGKYCTTVEGNMQYLNPAINTNYIICEAKITKTGAHKVFVTCEVKTDDGTLTDTANFTFYKTNIDA